MAEMTMIQAINDGLRGAMEADPDVLVFGEDVGVVGGVFRATEGLQERFGEERVFDTPLAESAIGGLAVGLAVQGFRPVAEIQFIGFVFEAFDAIAAQASRLRYRSGGRYRAPIVFRSPFGLGVRAPELHSDPLEGLLMQTPGLKVAIPSNPYDAKGLLIAAIRDNDPVFFLEHMKLYRSIRADVPEGEYTVPLGQAKVVREGKDVTVIAYGAMVHTALEAARLWEERRGAQAEIIDLRTISPLDLDTIIASVSRTNRAVVVQEAQRGAGAAAEIAAQIQERAMLHLEAPVVRVAAPDTVTPFPLIEKEWVPDAERVVSALDAVMDW